jgi:hypothetical protein
VPTRSKDSGKIEKRANPDNNRGLVTQSPQDAEEQKRGSMAVQPPVAAGRGKNAAAS